MYDSLSVGLQTASPGCLAFAIELTEVRCFIVAASASLTELGTDRITVSNFVLYPKRDAAAFPCDQGERPATRGSYA